MLQRLHIRNYRSIADATVELRPFTVLVGANGSGKSNLLTLLNELSHPGNGQLPRLTRHFRNPSEEPAVEMTTPSGRFIFKGAYATQGRPAELANVAIFEIDPRCIGAQEPLIGQPVVQANGYGAIQVLDSLKTGDREELFDTVERQLHEFVPEIEKLSFAPGGNVKSLQVRETGIPVPVPVRELSEGTRLVLTILTIVHQERKPSLICLEDLDHGLHPALFGKVVEACRALVRVPNAPQIIATTHNPYLVDQFIDDEESVLIVEKTDTNTTFTSLRDRLNGLDRSSDTLGGIWYSGLVGGTPRVPLKHLPGAGDPKPGA